MKLSRIKQVSVGTSATLIAHEDSQRGALLVLNITGTQVVYFGTGSDVTSTTGFPLPAMVGAAIRFTNKDEVWAITGSAQTVGVMEDLGEDGLPAVFLPADDVSLAASDLVIGRVKLTDGADVAGVGADEHLYTRHNKTLKTVTGTVSTDTDIVAAVTSKRIKVYSVSLMIISTTLVTVTMQSNASTALATYRLQGAADITHGISEGAKVPDFLFATVAGEKLTLDVSAAVSVTYNVRYWDDDAS